MNINALFVYILTFMALFAGCKKPIEIKEEFFQFTGTVVDQVTKQPVGNAKVYYAYKFLCEIDREATPIGPPVITGNDGSYKGKISKEISEDEFAYPCQVIYASKSGYIGSEIVSRTGGVIQLYHPSELQLHIYNDTISNQTDKIKIWIIGESRFWVYPGFKERLVMGYYPVNQFTCEGRYFDKTFVYTLWGNTEYSVGAGIDYMLKPHVYENKVTLEPNLTRHLDITF